MLVRTNLWDGEQYIKTTNEIKSYFNKTLLYSLYEVGLDLKRVTFFSKTEVAEKTFQNDNKMNVAKYVFSNWDR
jgi:hypothetical protein